MASLAKEWTLRIAMLVISLLVSFGLAEAMLTGVLSPQGQSVDVVATFTAGRAGTQ